MEEIRFTTACFRLWTPHGLHLACSHGDNRLDRHLLVHSHAKQPAAA